MLWLRWGHQPQDGGPQHPDPGGEETAEIGQFHQEDRRKPQIPALVPAEAGGRLEPQGTPTGPGNEIEDSKKTQRPLGIPQTAGQRTRRGAPRPVNVPLVETEP